MIPGDFLIIRVNEPELSETTRRFLEEVRPIGIHFGKEAFFSEKDYFSWVASFRELREQISEAVNRDKMIWAIDHEGGRVNRLPSPITKFSYPLNWQQQSRAVGSSIGKELCSLGFNVLFGPCLDIFSNPENKVIGPRSFGRSVPEVDEFSSEFIEALEKEDVLATGKHFPGHGDTEADSHFELPVLRFSLEQLLQRELLPFQYAMNGGLRAIMLAHILFPEIDKTLPSSLSPQFAKHLLREQLQFSGVSITDDLDMKALANNFSPQQIAQNIITGEINFVIFNHSLDHARRVVEELSAVISSRKEEVAVIAQRTESFITALGNPDVRALSDSVLEQHQRLSNSLPEMYEVEIEEFTGD